MTSALKGERSWASASEPNPKGAASRDISLVASARGPALMPAYAKNLVPWSVVSRPLEGEAPTIDLVIGYNKANVSPTLKLFLSRLDKLIAPASNKRGDPSREMHVEEHGRENPGPHWGQKAT